MMLFQDFDVMQTIHDYDYTKKARANLHRLTCKSEFSGMNAEKITDYLENQMEIVSFGDYLRRYIYQKAEILEPFYEVPQKTYEEIIRDSFHERNVPFTIERSSRKPSQTIRGWLTQMTVRRENVFLLGFGLGMDTSDVSMFLQKVIKDEDFIMEDPFERVCYEYLKEKRTWAEIKTAMSAVPGDFRERNGIWRGLLEEAKSAVSGKTDIEIGDTESLKAEEVSDTRLERSLYSALSIDPHGNLVTSDRIFRRYLAPVRLSRQRMSLLKMGETKVCRYDILSLVFLICAHAAVRTPDERLELFIQKANENLKSCRMKEIYPVNPFEAILLLCMLSDDPLDTYAELWEV